MNTQLLDQLANDRQTQIYNDAADRHLVAAAATPRASVRERAGWTLIHAGLKRGSAVVAFPAPLAGATWLLRQLPNGVADAVNSRLG